MSLKDTMRRLQARGVRLHGAAADSHESLSRQDEDPLPAAASVRSQTPPEAGRVLKQESVARGQESEARARREALEECERTLRRHRKSWIEAGHALTRIHRERLYLDQTFSCFEDYLEARHAWTTLRQAWNYIRAAAVAERVKAVNHQLSLNAAVALSRLKPPEKQAECLSRLIAEHGKSPTAKEVGEAVDRLLGKTRSNKKRPKPIRKIIGEWELRALPKAGADPRELESILRRWLDQLATRSAETREP